MPIMFRKVPVLLAGAAYAADGLWQLRHHQPDQNWNVTDRLIEVVFALALVASVAALPSIRGLIAERAGLVGARIAQLGFGGLFVVSTASALHGGNVLGPLFGISLLVALIGLGTLAVAGLRSSEREWTAPILLIGFLAGMALSDHGGSVFIGVAWLVVGWQLGDGTPATTKTAAAY